MIGGPESVDGARPAGRLLIWMHSDRYPAWRIPDALVSQLKTDGGDGWEVEAIPVPADASGDGPDRAPEPVLDAIAAAHVYFGYGITRELLEAAECLQWFHSGAAGVGGSLKAGMRERGVEMTNSAGVYADPLAEWAIGAMLHLASCKPCRRTVSRLGASIGTIRMRHSPMSRTAFAKS